MARGEWGNQGRGKSYSYKKITLIVCSINIVIALYVLRSIYGSIYVFSTNDLNVVKYTPFQIRKMEESIRIRRANEPIELVKWLKESKRELSEESMVELPRSVKQRMTVEILQRLRSLNVTGDGDAQREAVESWRKEKLEEAKQLIVGRQGVNSTILQEDARMLVRVLESNWDALSGEIGLWIPSEITQREHDDKPEGIEEEELLEEDILPGRPVPPECNAELHTDYAGAAVRWGLTHHKESAADCCQACLEQAKRAKPGQMKCNIWVYCPAETGCFSPDIYEHKNQECWLKYAEKPKLNFKHKYSESYRNSHPTAPLFVPWVSGVVSV
ncbi:uncharacterized protein LOC123202953 isoform X2 [Mangifera indica]|uniref:uncharacterized protein LOC123202953 isoform X2 n=1 Tax=Mangifera indica TaxID=29780 RepID=UPI001CFA78F2|nr:uncharacterized protein LOC123202953 isoform X2 [Mangifera indica]